MNKKDRRFQRTQKAIYQAFSQILLEKDLTEITVNDISSLADINRSTFYLHFEDKYALLYDYLLNLLPIEIPIDLTKLKNQQLFPLALGHLYDYLQDNKPLFQRLFNDRNYPYAMHAFKGVLKEFFTRYNSLLVGKIGDSAEFTVHIRIAGLIAMIEWFLSQRQYSREQFVKETYDLIQLLEKT